MRSPFASAGQTCVTALICALFGPLFAVNLFTGAAVGYHLATVGGFIACLLIVASDNPESAQD